ncbi:VWA domain-containing protein [Hydrogenimonas sp.]
MAFLNPWVFWFLVPVALLALLQRERRKEAVSPLHEKIMLDTPASKRIYRLQIWALVLMVAALARPVVQHPSVVDDMSAAPVYLALDLSASMRATDRKPSRLAYAKRVIERLLERDENRPYGLFGFTTNALILSPATRDHQLVEAAIESLNPDYIITRGTDLASLVETVAKMPQKRKRLVIFSDGGEEREIGSLLRRCSESGIRVYAVACATSGGATIPGASGGLLRDKDGRLVISVQNPSLGELAEATGGVFIDTADASDAARQLADALDEDLFTARQEVRVGYTELFWIPLLPALLLYLASIVSLPAPLKRVGAAVALLLGMQQADAGLLDLWRLHRAYDAYARGDFNRTLSELGSVRERSLQRAYAEASAYYKTGAYKKAARILSSIRTDDPHLKAAILYDLGNCAVKIGRFESARDFYLKSLRLREDPDTEANLAAVLFVHQKRHKKPLVKANKAVAASGKGEGSEKKSSGTSRKSRSAGPGQSGSGGVRKKGERHSQKSLTAGAVKFPLGSKTYELINKGYIDERKPW